jgi:DNA-binding NtrC family response regulator
MESKHHILLVDDSTEIVEALKSFLSRNYIVHTASNGLDALKVFERNKRELELVITDMVMPDLSGTALISMIRDKSPGTPIIAMTGWGYYPSLLATEAQANMVFHKPFDLADLDQAVSSFLSEGGKKKHSRMPISPNTGSTPLMPKVAFC